MKRLLLVLGVLATLWLGLEIVAPPVLARSIEAAVRQRDRDAAGVTASVGSFPIVAKGVATSRVDRVTVTLTDVRRVVLRFSRITFDARGVDLDRAALLRGDVEISHVDSGTVTAVIPDVRAPVDVEV